MLNNFCRFFVSLIICGLELTYSKDLPDFIQACHRSDPNLPECIKQSIETLRPHLITGVPDYNIPTIEPLVMEDLISEEAAGMNINAKNVSAYGCSAFIMKNIEVDQENEIYKFGILIPKLRIEAEYIVDGKILLLPIKGHGNLEANVTDCLADCVLKGETFEKAGQKYVRYTSIDLKAKVGGGTVRMENLFNNDKTLLGLLNDVINKNLNPFLKELMPVIEKGLAKIFLQVGNNVVDGYTVDQLYPD